MKKDPKRAPHIVIGGYYGFSSIGDDTVLCALVSGIRKRVPDCKISVICKRKGSLGPVVGESIKEISRKNPFSIFFALLFADLYISGGGSLFQDTTSKRSLVYYCALIRLAHILQAKVCIFANGMGPLKNERLCKNALRRADRISLRDPDSYEWAKRLCPEKKEIILSADYVFAFSKGRDRSTFPPCLCTLKGKPFFAVSLRECKGKRTLVHAHLLSMISYYQRQGFTPVFVSMQEEFDLETCKEYAERTGGAVADITCADELFLILEKAAFAVGMRLHFLFVSKLCAVPTVALSYDLKVDSCMKYFGGCRVLCAFDTTEKELITAIENARASNSPSFALERGRELSAIAESDLDDTLSLLWAKEMSLGESMEKYFADT